MLNASSEICHCPMWAASHKIDFGIDLLWQWRLHHALQKHCLLLCLTLCEYSVQANNDLVWNRQHQRSLWTQGMLLPDEVTCSAIEANVP